MSVGGTKTAGDPQVASEVSTSANLEGYEMAPLAIEIIFIPCHLGARFMKIVELFPEGCYVCSTNVLYGTVISLLR